MSPVSAFPTLSLDGTWSFTTDPQERGEGDQWFARTSGFGRQVEVPSAWQLYGRDLLHYTGSAWYYRACEVPADWDGRRIRLHVGASDYLTRAWVNGELVGEHAGGYTPFAFDLGAHVRPGETNHIVLRVYDPNDHGEIPHGQQGSHFTRVSGIWQPMRLEARAPLFIERLSPRTWLNPERVEAEATLSDPTSGVTVHFALQDHTGETVATASAVSENGLVRGWLEAPGARRWSPDDPYLYTLVATVGEGEASDAVSCHLGIRSVMAVDGRLYLNDQLLPLRGAVDHGYWPETLYAAPSDEMIQRELRLAKEAGVNVLRKHGKIEDPRYLDWCDRLGMLIWVEAPSCDRWTPQARQRFLADLHAMVARDTHRPSIIAWTLYQGNRGLQGAGTEMQPWLRMVHDEIAAADPTRPICTHAGGSAMRTDIIDEYKRYSLPEENRALDAALAGELPAAGAPRLVSEFGQWGLPDGFDVQAYEQWWLHEGPALRLDEARNPLTAQRNFEKFKLASIFEDLDNLAKLTQRRMTRGVKGLVEQFRRRPAFAGYVARSLYDTEWEGSGWLTYDRRPKLGFDEWGAFNAPIVVMAELPRHNYWVGDIVEATVWVSNHSKNPITGKVLWGIDGADCDGELEVEVAPFSTEAVGTIRVEAPAFAKPQATRLSLRLLSGGWDVNANYQEITISPTEAGQAAGHRVVVAHLGEPLKARFAAQGYEVVDEWEPGVAMVAGSLEADVQAALDAGAHVVFLAEKGAQTPHVGFLSFRSLPHSGDSDARMRSVNYIQWDLFPQLPLNTLMGWEMEDLAPQHVVPLGTYTADGQVLMSNQAEEDPANVLAGYFEGWLGHFSASMLLQSAGRGRLLTTTLRLGSHYGEHPIATMLLNRLLTESHLFELRTVYQLET
jgi:hypothetical protein